MKTERRHELQTNELADWLGHQFEHVKPHGKTILAASILGTRAASGQPIQLYGRTAAFSALAGRTNRRVLSFP